MFRNGGSNIYNSWANDNRVCKFVLLPGTKADPQFYAQTYSATTHTKWKLRCCLLSIYTYSP
jgi:hypothetical protein